MPCGISTAKKPGIAPTRRPSSRWLSRSNTVTRPSTPARYGSSTLSPMMRNAERFMFSDPRRSNPARANPTPSSGMPSAPAPSQPRSVAPIEWPMGPVTGNGSRVSPRNSPTTSAVTAPRRRRESALIRAPAPASPGARGSAPAPGTHRDGTRRGRRRGSRGG